MDNFFEVFNLLDISENCTFKIGNCISARSLLILALQNKLNKKCLVITDTSKSAEKYLNDISVFSPQKVVSLFNKDKFYFSGLSYTELPDIIISTYRNIIQKIPKMKYLAENTLSLEVGKEVRRDDILNFCEKQKYTFEFRVENIGEVSFRGGIVDIFSPTFLEPVRIELTGNTVQTIRFFNIHTQRWEKKIQDITIYPNYFPQIDDIFTTLVETLTNYLVIEDDETEEKEWKRIKEIILSELTVMNFSLFEGEVEINIKTVDNFYQKVDLLVDKIMLWQREKKKIFIYSYHAERLSHILRENEIYEVEPQLVIIKNKISSGFETKPAVFLSDNEILTTSFVGAKKKIPAVTSLSLQSPLSLEVGDYVVHLNYGVGKYLGVVNLKFEECKRDFLEIKYIREEKLYVPVENINLLRKYENLDGTPPTLNSLRGNTWAATKKGLKKKAEEISNHLRELYQIRNSASGFRFCEDGLWQKELEDSFPYAETPGQIEALAAAKQDMESEKIMDRLICGDVGFGKTEIALRCAFKAVQDGKQVAILTPTTILSHQHYLYFSDRLSMFPVKVGVLSRFVHKDMQKEIIREIKKGIVDIIVGTHRLLQKDIEFKDLGLLIVDEEQRFGVMQKEKLKEMRKNIDVLTLTATPIPRTLYLALSGIREISTMETPPEDRLAVKTYLLEYSEKVIREAIYEEVDKEGQVYFIHNRVQTIERQREILVRLCPEVKICVAHGQLSPDQMERKFFSFVEGKYDVLLCSTIVESGIDVPRANTIIINNAENFGLAQLYQLRGRVGRSSRQACAYLLYSPHNIKKGKAWDRLQALQEFTQLGSSYQLAKRDLEIRGAGNILGKEQSGYIEQIGVDLWCEFLQGEAGEEKAPLRDEVIIDLPVSGFIPDEYVENWKEKIFLYKKMSVIEKKEEIDDLKEEMEDRFGKYPPEVGNLFELLNIKIFLKALGCKKLEVRNKKIYFEFTENGISKMNLEKLKSEYDFSLQGKEVYFEAKGDHLKFVKEVISKLS